MTRLQDKVILLSGTGRGIGRAAALRFAAEGAVVAGGDLLEDDARETMSLIEAAGGTGSVSRVDVTDERSVGDWVQAAVARFGRIDVVYANAGAVRFGAVDEQPVADWRFTLATELDSVFLTVRAAWPHLVSSSGVIITVGSTAGISGSVTNKRVAHAASKGGVIALTRQLAAEGAQHGIRAVCISPGMIATEGSRENLLAPDHPMRAIAGSIPLGRLGTPEDVVSAAVFLSSDEASYITGANLVVDGGWSSVLPG
ncbi:MAG TPA: SDR family NAD(P)-dependent oxidoreductase [Solirubrobacteraceae bacterium]|nr:SDR family NAD(P)-dependent oxidoreductase [Solirubrobacteraceae bacterium]